MNRWSLVYHGFSPQEERLREALCTLGNGYFATRGAGTETVADGVHYPGTYLAGGYNRLDTEIAGRVIENEDLVNMPNWLPLTFRLPGSDWFSLEEVEILSYRQELDLRRGIFLRSVSFRDQQGRQTNIEERRLVHMADKHLAALEMRLTAKNWSGEVEIRSGLDGLVTNQGVDRYKKLNSNHLEPLITEEVDEETIYLKVLTKQSKLNIAQGARTRVFLHGQPYQRLNSCLKESGRIFQEFAVDLAEGAEVRVEKVVSFFTSRDKAISECGLEAHSAVARAASFESLLESHTRSWEHLWRRFEVDFIDREPEESDRTEVILRLYIFHLLQTTSSHTMDLDVGVPSRGWHGEAYRGHIFWDELFIFPMLNLRLPEITRSLLMYRFRRLDRARLAAKKAGYRGAMFPWQSGSNGREETQEVHLNPKSGRWIPDNSHLQRHVNAAIAYNIWHYSEVTGDREFLSFYGAEMILEIARFWASIATYNSELDRYEILRVMGPDEYHDGYPQAEQPGLNNNAYTNVMAVWVLNRALEIPDILPEERSRELLESIDLRQEEIDQWREISKKMRLVFHGGGIISQFEGYDELEEFDWQGYRRKYKDIQRLDRVLEAEDDTPNGYKASKQADVLMLFYLFSSEKLQKLFNQLGYSFEYETIPKNIDYYLRRTSHGSTLSRVVHSWVLARSDRVRSWKFFCEALKSDIEDIQGGTTPEGIHLGAMAGTVDLISRGYTGIEPRNNVLWFNPCLPEEMAKLHVHIRYRGHALEVEVTSDRLQVRTLKSTEMPIKVGFKGKTYDLEAGSAVELILGGVVK
jgi:alpha,alpha-trehalase